MIESYEAMQNRESWCDNCRHQHGYHHLCKKGKCKCSVCKMRKKFK